MIEADPSGASRGDASLHFVCGSHPSIRQGTPARHIARRFRASLVADPQWHASLCDPRDHQRQQEVEARVLAALRDSKDLVVDVPANTPAQRRWIKSLVEKTGARHRLHYLVASAPFHRQMQQGQAEESGKASPFIPPRVEEGFNVEVSTYSG